MRCTLHCCCTHPADHLPNRTHVRGGLLHVVVVELPVDIELALWVRVQLNVQFNVQRIPLRCPMDLLGASRIDMGR